MSSNGMSSSAKESQQKQQQSATSQSNSTKVRQNPTHQILRQFKLISVNFKEAALDSPSFRASVNHLDVQLMNIEQWFSALSSSMKKMPKYIKEVETFCDSFLEYLFPSFLQEGFVDQEYSSQALRATLAGMKQIWSRSLFALNISPSISNDLTQFRTANLIKYKELRRKFEMSQRKYDRYLNVFVSSSKSKDAVSVIEDAKQLYQVRKEYLHISLDLICEMQDLRTSLDKLIVSLISTLWEKKYSVFATNGPGDLLAKHYSQIQRVQGWSKSIMTASNDLKNDMLLARKQVEDGSSLQFQPSLNANDYKVSTISYKSLQDINEFAIEKHGYLFMKTWTDRSVKPIWVRRWCFIKNGVFGMFLLSASQTSVQESDKIGLFLCNIRYAPNEDRRFCFDVKTSEITITLQAESLVELKSWLKVFDNEKDRISALPPDDDLFRVASTRFPPIFAEFASTENTSVDLELSSSKVFNSSGSAIVSSSMIRNYDKFAKALGVDLYADMPRVHPPIITDRTRDSFVAHCASFKAIDIPHALTANVWGSVNWGLYYLTGANDIEKTPFKRILVDQSMIEYQAKHNDSAVPYPPFYPRDLITFDIQMRALFDNVVEVGEYCVMSFCCIWAPNSKQELSGRSFITTHHIYFYMQALGFVALYKSYIGECVSIEATSQPGYDSLKVYTIDGSIKMKLFMENAKIIRNKFQYLIDNIVSENPKNLEDVLVSFKEIEADINQETHDRDVVREINNLTKTLSNKAVINNRFFVGGDTASILPNKSGKVTSYQVDFTSQFSLVSEKSYSLPPKAIFHALLGDDSEIFNRQTATLKFGFEVKKPWRLDTQNGNVLYRQGVRPVLLNGKAKQLKYQQIIEKMDDNSYYVFTYKLSHFDFLLGSPFSLLVKFVLVGAAGKRTKVYYYLKTIFERGSCWNPIINQITRSICFDQFSKIDQKLRNAVKAVGTHGQIVKAIYLYGKLSHTSDPDTDDFSLQTPVIQLGVADCVSLLTHRTGTFIRDVIIGLITIIIEFARLVFNNLKSNQIYLLMIIVLIGSNVFLLGKTSITYWTVHRSNSLAEDFVRQNPLILQRAVYSQDVMDEFKAQVGSLNSTISSSKPFQIFESESFTYNYQNLSKLINDGGVLGKPDVQDIHNKLRSEFRSIGIERYDLLVKLRLLQTREKEIIQREFSNWLVNEVDRCDSMQEYVVAGLQNEKKRRQVHGGTIQQNSDLVEGVDEVVNYCNNCKQLLSSLL
ncbi:SIP3 [Candida theae]|uniref:SIP3 n=1 Tax=Candida theae TaxID=1198502 RepID=A0AAD5BJK5_9ASCO|nr:SIP3 [Candida theae]KAI5967436.1 SIP3 [Candida theae]